MQTVNLSLRRSVCSLNQNPYFSALRGVNRKACGELILPVRTGARRAADEDPQIQRGLEPMCSEAGRGLITVWTPAAKIRQVCSVTGGGDGEKDREGEREDE